MAGAAAPREAGGASRGAREGLGGGDGAGRGRRRSRGRGRVSPEPRGWGSRAAAGAPVLRKEEVGG